MTDVRLPDRIVDRREVYQMMLGLCYNCGKVLSIAEMELLCVQRGLLQKEESR